MKTELFNELKDDLLSICETEEESIDFIKDYVNEYPYSTDFNIVQYGNILGYFGQVRDMYSKHMSAEELNNLSDTDLWDIYKKDIGYVVKKIILK